MTFYFSKDTPAPFPGLGCGARLTLGQSLIPWVRSLVVVNILLIFC